MKVIKQAKGRQNLPPKQGGVKKKGRSYKDRIRGLERLLKKPDLDPRARTSKEAELEKLKQEAAQHQRADKERKIAQRYHKVKFFERVKIERRLGQLEKRAKQQELTAKEQQELNNLQEDLSYVKHFPKGQKYVSLLRVAETPEAQKQLEESRAKLRALIKAQLAEQALVTEADEGRGQAAVVQQARVQLPGTAQHDSEGDDFFLDDDADEDTAGALGPVHAAATTNANAAQPDSNTTKQSHSKQPASVSAEKHPPGRKVKIAASSGLAGSEEQRKKRRISAPEADVKEQSRKALQQTEAAQFCGGKKVVAASRVADTSGKQQPPHSQQSIGAGAKGSLAVPVLEVDDVLSEGDAGSWESWSDDSDPDHAHSDENGLVAAGGSAGELSDDDDVGDGSGDEGLKWSGRLGIESGGGSDVEGSDDDGSDDGESGDEDAVADQARIEGSNKRLQLHEKPKPGLDRNGKMFQVRDNHPGSNRDTIKSWGPDSGGRGKQGPKAGLFKSSGQGGPAGRGQGLKREQQQTVAYGQPNKHPVKPARHIPLKPGAKPRQGGKPFTSAASSPGRRDKGGKKDAAGQPGGGKATNQPLRSRSEGGRKRRKKR